MFMALLVVAIFVSSHKCFFGGISRVIKRVLLPPLLLLVLFLFCDIRTGQSLVS